MFNLKTKAKDINVFGFIYIITNLVNKKRYVGQTTNSIWYRFSRHLIESLEQNSKNRSSLHLAIKKYGKENFSIELFAIASSRQILDKLENKAILKLKTNQKSFGYNLKNGGNQADYNEEYCKLVSIRAKNRNYTPEWRLKLSENGKKQIKLINPDNRNAAVRKALLGKKKSPEDIAKRNLKRRFPIIAINRFTGEVTEFPGINVCAIEWDLDSGLISKVCMGKNNYYKKWFFYYLEEFKKAV
jgi:group I intron endonuclease